MLGRLGELDLGLFRSRQFVQVGAVFLVPAQVRYRKVEHHGVANYRIGYRMLDIADKASKGLVLKAAVLAILAVCLVCLAGPDASGPCVGFLEPFINTGLRRVVTGLDLGNIFPEFAIRVKVAAVKFLVNALPEEVGMVERLVEQKVAQLVEVLTNEPDFAGKSQKEREDILFRRVIVELA